MAGSITHTKVSAKSDGGDSSLVLPSDWNAGHTFSGLVQTTDVDDTPADGATTDPISSNWAYDHAATKDAHGVQVITKTADETVNNSTTLQSDNHLYFTNSAAGAWYLVKMFLRVLSNATPDFKYAFTVPSGTGIWSLPAYNTIGVFTDLTSPQTLSTNGSSQGIWLNILVTCGSTLGDIQLQWAQNTANASDTQVQMASCLIVEQLK
jgi:hypothetical protein